MPPKTITLGSEIREKLRIRREALNLTVEEAARKAHVSPKTWSRYETRGNIRKDKLRNVCKAMKWSLSELNEETFAQNDASDPFIPCPPQYSLPQKAPAICQSYGKYAETAFLVGSDTLLDDLNFALWHLEELPRGRHAGTLCGQATFHLLPPQFIPRYDYEFLYAMRASLITLRKRAGAPSGRDFRAHTVMEEILLYMSSKLANDLFDDLGIEQFLHNEKEDAPSQHAGDPDMDDNDDNDTTPDPYTMDWVFDLFDDMDVVTYLYTPDIFLRPSDSYHFDHWFENQFYIEESTQDINNRSSVSLSESAVIK